MQLIDDLKTPSGCIAFTTLLLGAAILIPIGLLGMFKGWGSADLFTVIFTIGVICAGMSILITLCAAVEFIAAGKGSHPQPPPV
jgi:hypothetical protein